MGIEHPRPPAHFLVWLILTGVILSPAPIESAEAQSPIPWVITGETTWSDHDVALDRPLIVAPGAILTLLDLRLTVHPGGEIQIAPGGTLHVQDSTLKGAPDAPPWIFQSYGRIHIHDSTVEGSHTLELRYAGTIGSQIRDTVLIDNRPHAVTVINRGSLEFTDNLVVGSGAGLRITDASVQIEDNVFLANPGFGLALVSSLAGSRVFGPTVAEVRGNVFADGGGGIHFQEGNRHFIRIEGNLLTNLVIGLRLQEATEEAGQAEFTENSIVDNRYAGLNFGRANERDVLNELVGYTVDLGDSYLGPDGATWESGSRNRLHGPFATEELLDEDPAPRLWNRLDEARTLLDRDLNKTS